MNIIIRKAATLRELVISRSPKKEILRRIIKNIQGKSSKFTVLVDTKELRPQVERAIEYLSRNLKQNEEFGDYLEFGVCHGTSFSLMYNILEEQQLKNVRLFGFDSFKGLPKDSEGKWFQGAFYAKEKNVRRFLTSKGLDWNRAKLIKGWFKDTLNQEFIKKEQLKKASIIMIDCDIYSATKEALNFCRSLIKNQCIIIFDDWNSRGDSNSNGERRAFDEFLKENPLITSKDFGEYSYFGKPNGVIKLVTTNNAN